MSKVLQAFLSGIFFTFILDFFLFLGIKLHYIDFYEIDIYYNILFADHQCIILYALVSAFLGYMTTYYSRTRHTALLLAALFAAVLLTLIPPIGKAVGGALLIQKDQTLHDSRYSYHGDIYYEGRQSIYIYDDELQELINLSKKELRN